ncbi:MAG: T9SS type A sorting domain-containing protein [Bacteroidota bacterium]
MRRYRCGSKRFPAILVLAVLPLSASAQPDTVTHGWPVVPFFNTHPITGVFCEFRNTLTSDHFHNGTDIPFPDGTPVYPVHDGTITAVGSVASSGDNAYVRVRYTGDAVWSMKTDAYVHIAPNPNLLPGDAVYAHATVLGTILPGLGHVHFTNGQGSGEMNALRPVGGFAPYLDAYRPRILSVRFFIDELETELIGGRVSGAVDIRAHVAETSAADASGLRSSTMNNGTYLAGYKILTADGSTVAYEPPDGGVRYQFDRKPVDGDVHRVFSAGSDVSTHIYTLTNGAGANLVNSTRSVPNGAWDTMTLPEGDYLVMVFTQDTRGLSDTVYLPVRVLRGDLVPPAPPILSFVGSDSTNRIMIRWRPNGEPDLAGYRLEFSTNGSTWTQKEDESRLTRADTAIAYTVTSGTIFFRLAAVDSSAPPNVSGYSDVYGVRLNSGNTRTLIVDGFDRTETAGSYHTASHPFAMTHGLSVPGNFNTCSNEALIGGSVALVGYGIVDWLLGDESANDETFNADEQSLVQTYLQGGGKLFVSGSEIAYDLDRLNGPTQEDRDFLHSFLKVSYAGDDAGEYTVAGATGTTFGGLTFRYGVIAEGSPYEEDWPDYLTPSTGANTMLYYGSQGGLVAAAGFTGIFSGGSREGAVVTWGFPFETIGSRTVRDTLMRRVFAYFNTVTGISSDIAAAVPNDFALGQNYPNPFNPATVIRYQMPVSDRVTLKVFDILGREIITLLDGQQPAGYHEVLWNATGIASGVYFCRMDAAGFSAVRKMMVLK